MYHISLLFDIKQEDSAPTLGSRVITPIQIHDYTTKTLTKPVLLIPCFSSTFFSDWADAASKRINLSFRAYEGASKIQTGLPDPVATGIIATDLDLKRLPYTLTNIEKDFSHLVTTNPVNFHLNPMPAAVTDVSASHTRMRFDRVCDRVSGSITATSDLFYDSAFQHVSLETLSGIAALSKALSLVLSLDDHAVTTASYFVRSLRFALLCKGTLNISMKSDSRQQDFQISTLVPVSAGTSALAFDNDLGHSPLRPFCSCYFESSFAFQTPNFTSTPGYSQPMEDLSKLPPFPLHLTSRTRACSKNPQNKLPPPLQPQVPPCLVFLSIMCPESALMSTVSLISIAM